MLQSPSPDISAFMHSGDTTKFLSESMDLRRILQPKLMVNQAVQHTYHGSFLNTTIKTEPTKEHKPGDLTVIPLELKFNIHNRPKTPKHDYYESVNKQLRQKYRKMGNRDTYTTFSDSIQEKTLATSINWLQMDHTSDNFYNANHLNKSTERMPTEGSYGSGATQFPFVNMERPQTRYVKQELRSISKKFKLQSPMCLLGDTDKHDTNSPTPVNQRYKTTSPHRSKQNRPQTPSSFFGFVPHNEENEKLTVHKPEFEIVETSYGLRRVLKSLNQTFDSKAKPYLNMNKVSITDSMQITKPQRRRLNQSQAMRLNDKDSNKKIPVPEPGINTYNPFPKLDVNCLLSPDAAMKYKATAPLVRFKRDLRKTGNLFTVLHVLEQQHFVPPRINVKKAL